MCYLVRFYCLRTTESKWKFTGRNCIWCCWSVATLHTVIMEQAPNLLSLDPDRKFAARLNSVFSADDTVGSWTSQHSCQELMGYVEMWEQWMSGQAKRCKSVMSYPKKQWGEINFHERVIQIKSTYGLEVSAVLTHSSNVLLKFRQFMVCAWLQERIFEPSDK